MDSTPYPFQFVVVWHADEGGLAEAHHHFVSSREELETQVASSVSSALRTVVTEALESGIPVNLNEGFLLIPYQPNMLNLTYSE